MSKSKAVGGGIGAGLLLAAGVVVCGAFLGYKGQEGDKPRFEEPVVVESEDCDYGDWIENDPDCAGVIIAPQSPKPSASKRPTPRRTR